jgi:hypothetical protein
MTLTIGIYDNNGTLSCSIKAIDTGTPADQQPIHKQVANTIEVAAYETVRKLVANNEIPEAHVIWENQTIRIKQSR